MSKKSFVLGAMALGAGVLAWRTYKATHPAWARGPISADPGRSRPRLPDSLFEVPEDVIHHSIPSSDGGNIHVVERGEGRPLVLLHGVTLRYDVWAPQLNDLADRYRVIAVDLRGHGESFAGEDGYGLGCLAQDLATTLEALDLRDAIVVGHSMGGMTVMHFCGQHRDVLAERVAGLVFVATRAHQVLPPFADRRARLILAKGQSMLEAGRPLPTATTSTRNIARLAFGENPSPRAVDAIAEMGDAMEPEAMLASAAGLMDHDSRAALRETNTPSLVVAGTRDILTPVPSASHLAHILPNSEFVVLARAGHQIMQERPAELAELIDEFAAHLPEIKSTDSSATTS
ncbi:MAG: alpha/beta hydrolase [Acidimicrobiales bacterium]|nr:alpha/beta hydrolase [Acidimicrobiales bacterium]